MKTFNDYTEEYRQTYEAMVEDLKQFHDNFPEMPQVCQDIEEIQCPEGVTISAWWAPRWGGSISVTILGLHSFKDPQLCDLLEQLAEKYNCEFSSNDMPEYFCRMYSAHMQWERGNFDITVEARVRNDSDGCTRVQVGVEARLVETPIYRLDCSDKE